MAAGWRDPVEHSKRGWDAPQATELSSAYCPPQPPQPEVTASFLKLLPDTTLDHYHFSPCAELGLFALILSIIDFPRKQTIMQIMHKAICPFLLKFSIHLNHAFSA